MRSQSPRLRTGLAGGAAAALAALALSMTPLVAYADEAPPPDAPAVVEPEPAAVPEAAPEPAAPDPEPAAPEPAEPTEPAEPEPAEPAAVPDVVVAEPGTTVEETLAEAPDAPTVTLFAEEGDEGEPPVAAAVPAPGDPCYPAVCITNGTILLAVNPTGELNTSDGTGSAAGPGDAGLEYVPTGNDSTSPGCLCEGWGVAIPATGQWGGADLDTEGAGGTNLVLESFESTSSTATSVVLVVDESDVPLLRVRHEYLPSPVTPNLYQVNVTIENLTGAPIATLQYRRVMDWDIEPTAFDEFVTIEGGTASALYYSSDDGFASPNPLTGPSSINFEGEAVDNGPEDHGALFDFAFGPIGVGGAVSFVIFYGGAASEAEAVAALAAVGAEAYSFGQTSTDPVTGTPNTFIFAFGNIGGAPVFEPPGETPAGQPGAVPAVAPAPAAATPTAEVADASGLASTGVESGWTLWLVAALLLLGGVVLGAARFEARRS